MALPKRIRLAGIIMLASGLVAAVLIYCAQPAEDNSGVNSDFLGKPDIYQLEKLGGKATVIAVEINSWFSSLWHGKELAYTLGCLSVVGFVVCFSFANLLTDPADSDEKKTNS